MAQKTVLTFFTFAAGLLFAQGAHAATLFISPAGGTYYTGRTMTVGVYVSSPNAAVNAAQGALSFPNDKLSVISISKTNSIVNLWVQDPTFSNQDGTVNFGGITVNPGFTGAKGQLLSVTFQIKNTGAAEVSFSSASVLANDGKGTSILDGMQGASFVLAKDTAAVPGTSFAVSTDPVITDGLWHNTDSVAFTWKLPASGVDGVAYNISNSPGYVLPKVAQGTVSSISYDLSQFEDGAWYFYVAYEVGERWAPTTRLSFNLDRTPPEPFVLFQKDSSPAFPNGRPEFQWLATDKTSGIARYLAKIGDGDWFDASTIARGSLYTLPSQSPTQSRTLTVRAYDRAGNVREETTDFMVIGSCVGGWTVCGITNFVSNWSWVLVVIVMLCIIMAYWLIYRVFVWRRHLREELLSFRNELGHDLKRLETRMDEDTVKATEHLEADVQETINKIDTL